MNELFIGYIFDTPDPMTGEMKYKKKQYLKTTKQLTDFLSKATAIGESGIEIMVTDALDCVSYHMKDGKLVFPRLADIRAAIKSKSDQALNTSKEAI